MADYPTLTRYLVTWHLTDSPDDVRRNRVVLEQGYNTLDDVPRMIGIAMALDPGHVVVTRAVRVDDTHYRRAYPKL